MNAQTIEVMRVDLARVSAVSISHQPQSFGQFDRASHL
jgi:hypothetical protein